MVLLAGEVQTELERRMAESGVKLELCGDPLMSARANYFAFAGAHMIAENNKVMSGRDGAVESLVQQLWCKKNACQS